MPFIDLLTQWFLRLKKSHFKYVDRFFVPWTLKYTFDFWKDGGVHPGDVEFTSASRFYGSVHGHSYVFNLLILFCETQQLQGLLRSPGQKEKVYQNGLPVKELMGTV